MGRRALAIAVVLSTVIAGPLNAETAAAPLPQYVTYTEEVPCPPDGARIPLHRARAKRRVIRRPKHLAAVTPRPKAHPRPARHIRVVHHVRPQRARLLRVVDPMEPKRCTVVRREGLTPASFGITPESAVLTPVIDEVEPGGPATPQTSSGRAAFANPAEPAIGGGGPSVGSGGGVVSSAPEPGSWLLMLAGVGLAGVALRRRRPMRVS